MKKWALLVYLFILLLALMPSINAQEGEDLETYCYNCHINQEDPRINTPPKEWKDSIHSKNAVGCDQCHGRFHTQIRENLTRRDYVLACLRCHKFDGSSPMSPSSDFYQLAELVGSESEIKITFSHGTSGISKASLKEGKPEPPVCADCHNPHGTRSVSEAESWVSHQEVTETCGGREGRECHDSENVSEAYSMVNAVVTFEESFHGKLKTTGVEEAAGCKDCHAQNYTMAHNILPQTDPSSPVHESNVGKICAGCHGDLMLTAWITSGTLHADSSRLHLRGGIPTSVKYKTGGYYIGPFFFGPFDVVVYTYKFMVFLLLMVMTIMLSLFTLDLARKISEGREHRK